MVQFLKVWDVSGKIAARLNQNAENAMTLRIAIDLSSTKLSLRRAIAVAAEMGAGGLQLEWGREINAAEMSESARRQLQRELGERGLRIAGAVDPC